MREIVQFVLKVLRWFHIDVYVMMKNHAERRMWRRALPENGVLGEKGLCVAVPLRSFSSVGQVGRDFVRRLIKTSIPFSLFNIAASDAYLSLHRGEGFGIGMLEAMSVRTPVVCTNYGGNTEFCKPETAYLVDYRMVPNDHPDKFYIGVPEWPEPNVETAARHLRTIFENPVAAQATADRALAFIRDHFSLANFESDLRKFIEAMTGESIHI